MLIETQTLIVGGILLFIAVVTSLCSAFFRRPKIIEMQGTPDSPVRFSIVMSVCEQAELLARRLPLFLQQDYPDFEVIVVDDSSSDNTNDVLSALKAQYPNLYTTFIPKESHYLSRTKLALTVGVKAAKYEWLVFTGIDCEPTGNDWLTTLARYCEHADVVCGYTGLTSAADQYRRFERLRTNCYLMRSPYRYEGQNLAIRKDVFLANNGFQNNLTYLRGEYDYLVNECRRHSRVTTMTETQGRMIQDDPDEKTWREAHLQFAETRHHLKHTFGHRLLYHIDTLCCHLGYLVQLAALAFSLTTQRWQLAAIAGVCLLLTLGLRIFFANRAAKAFDEHISLLKLPFYELRVAWQNLRFTIAHKKADRYNYIRR